MPTRTRRRSPRARRTKGTDLSWMIPVGFTAGVIFFAWVLTVIGGTGSPPGTRLDSSICGSKSVQELVNDADLVLTGSVFAVLPGQPYARVLITPDHVYRGTVPAAGITVLALPTQDQGAPGAPSSDLHFTSADSPYLLFLHKKGDGSFTTNRCDGSRLLGSGLQAEELSALNVGYSFQTP